MEKISMFNVCIELPDNAIHVEFNVWTVPDCFGTSNETPNRTWFHFSIRGGAYYQNVKINVKNLNRQAKLFSQGMSPVMKIGENGHWHRIKDAPTYQNEDENFVISFIHKVQNHSDTEIYYAFTYPFSYKDCLNLLNKFDEKYFKTSEEVDIIIKQICKKLPVELLLPSIENLFKKQISNTSLSCYTTNTSCIKDFETLARKELQNEIYYHRELLIKSLEGRRVDLLTVTSFHGIQGELERKLDNLFPEPSLRCHVFKNKKVIFLSSRVHPGETPASFVLNGFLNLILDRKNPVSITLRKMYVFKIVPILNPDGVYHGYYRTDTLGQNLNRMYMDTIIDYHPSIYAVKKLIKFYQNGASTYSDIDDIVCDTKIPTLNISTDIQKNCEFDNTEIELDDDKESNNILSEILKSRSESCSSTESDITECNKEIISVTRKIVENETNMLADENESTKTKQMLTQMYSKKVIEPKILKKVSMKTIISGSTISLNRNENKMKDNIMQTRAIGKKTLTRRSDSKSSSTNCNNHTNCSTIPSTKLIAMSQNKGKIRSQIKSASTFTESVSFSSNSLDGGNNLFLYIDMHGHASKKGVFMYGNHFTNLGQAVECMLLPKLMTINSQHFHFDACNFSEKNMYKKEKRDGLSKEGSGRVAVYKMTGLIKCYTLECNYNCGKYINILPSKNNIFSKQMINTLPPKYSPSVYEEVGRALGSSILDLTNSNSSSRLPNSEYRTLQGVRSSLRYDVDRSASSHNKPNTANVTSKISSKRRNNISSSSNSTTISSNKETAKENCRDILLNKWNAVNDTAACSSSYNNSGINTHSQISQKSKSTKLTSTETLPSTTTTAVTKITLSNSKLINKTLKKSSSYKIRSTCLYGKKDSPSLITKKKAKILVESSNSGTAGTSTMVKKELRHHSLQKTTNTFKTNVPSKRVKVTLKTITSTNSNCNTNSNIINLSNTKDKKVQQQFFKMPKTHQENDISSSSLYGCNINQINTNDITAGAGNLQQGELKEIILPTTISISSLSPSSSENEITRTISPRPPCFFLIESNSLSNNNYKIEKNDKNEKDQHTFEASKLTNNNGNSNENEIFLNVLHKHESIKKSSSIDSGLCAMYQNSFYKTNSIQHLPLDDNTTSIGINTTELIKSENHNFTTPTNNFAIPSGSSTNSSIFSIKANNDKKPPNKIHNDDNNNNNNTSDSINNNNFKNNTNNKDGINNSSTSNNDNEMYNSNIHSCISIESEKICKKKLPSSSLSLLSTQRKIKKPLKSESMIYKNRKIRKDSNKKVTRNYFCTLESSKLKKKRTRGFDSITIKHKKNKIRNTRF